MLKNILKKALPAAAALGALACSTGAMAGPAIGLNTGTSAGFPAIGGGFNYTDHWTNNTDTALSIGFQPNTTVPPVSPYTTDLISQMRLSTTNQGKNPLQIFGFAGLPELTQIYKLTELVTAQTPGTNATATFGMPAAQTYDVDSAHAGNQQFAWYLDSTADGSLADPSNVSCYGQGTCASNDGIMIASGHLTQNISSFAAAGNVGTGSFDLTFVFDYVDSQYLDTKKYNIYGFRITGTTNVPPSFNPATMWDGTATASGLKLKVDSSFDFLAVPEPSSIALVGLAMGGLGVTTFGRRRNKKA